MYYNNCYKHNHNDGKHDFKDDNAIGDGITTLILRVGLESFFPDPTQSIFMYKIATRPNPT